MKSTQIYYNYLDIYDEKVFTPEKVNEWKNHIFNSYVKSSRIC